jgi:hypothetical protein
MESSKLKNFGVPSALESSGSNTAYHAATKNTLRFGSH